MPDNDKTPEQIKAEKIKKFSENPDQFVDLDDVIIATIHTSKGMGLYTGPKLTRGDIEKSFAKISHVLHQIMALMDMQDDKEREGKIITGNKKGGIMKFVRGKR